MILKNLIIITSLLFMPNCIGNGISRIFEPIQGSNLTDIIPHIAKIIKEPQDHRNLAIGSSVELSVEVENNYLSEQSYQWQRAESTTTPNTFVNLVENSTENVYRIPSLKKEDHNSAYRVVITIKRKSDNNITVLTSNTSVITLQAITVSFNANGGLGSPPVSVNTFLGSQLPLPTFTTLTKIWLCFYRLEYPKRCQ